MPTETISHQTFNLQKLSLVEASYKEHRLPRSPEEENQVRSSPSEMRVKVTFRIVSDGRFETILTVDAHPEMDEPVFSASASIRGWFQASNPKTEQTVLEGLAKFAAPQILYPFVRETIASLTSRGLYGMQTLPIINLPAELQAQQTRENVAPHAKEKDSEPPTP